MRDMRKYKRFNLDLIDLSSKVSLVSKVEIIDISVGGVALKADRKLNIGKECLVMLEYKGQHINAKGVVVRSELIGLEKEADGEPITIYSAGLSFKDESTGKVKDFLASIEKIKKTQVPVQADWICRYVRFRIITSSEKVLNMPTQFGIKEISQTGVIIRADHQLKTGSMVLIELSLNDCEPAVFVGKIVPCHLSQEKARSIYYTAVKFQKLTDRSKSLLIKLIDFVKENEHVVNSGKIGND